MPGGGFMEIDHLENFIQCLKSIQVYEQSGQIIRNYNRVIYELVNMFLEIRNEQKNVFFIGNGGSAAIASHMTADFMKNGKMKTCSLYDHSVMTCMGNDYGYEYVFSKPLEFLGNEGDLLVAISSSGNSQNIVNALEVAREKGLKIITFTGFHNTNRIIEQGSYNVYVPVCHYGMVESIHNLILQQIVDTILERDNECLK